MAFDIDIEDYGRDIEPAAVDSKVVDHNFYQEEVGDQPIHPELKDVAEKEQLPKSEELAVENPKTENFRALREEVDRIKAEKDLEKREYQLQIDMLKANLSQNQSIRQQERQTEREQFSGLKDDDIPNVGEIKREWMAREAAYQSKIEELQVQQMHPDYAEVIEKFALPLIKQKPHLMQGIQGADNKALMAYELGKMAQQIQSTPSPVQTKPSEMAQRMVENSRKPGTLSQAGGQKALSQADYFATMSDKEFMKFASRNMEQI